MITQFSGAHRLVVEAVKSDTRSPSNFRVMATSADGPGRFHLDALPAFRGHEELCSLYMNMVQLNG